jgi:hypothetical protein
VHFVVSRGGGMSFNSHAWVPLPQGRGGGLVAYVGGGGAVAHPLSVSTASNVASRLVTRLTGRGSREEACCWSPTLYPIIGHATLPHYGGQPHVAWPKRVEPVWLGAGFSFCGGHAFGVEAT